MEKLDRSKKIQLISRSIDKVTMASIYSAVWDNDQKGLVSIFKKIHAADIADFLEQVNRSHRKSIISLWGDSINGEVLSELEEGVRDELLEMIPDEILVKSIRKLQTDDLVHLIEDLDDKKREKLLQLFDKPEQIAIERLLQYDEDTAGRLMQLELVTAPEYWTVGNAIDFLRSNSDLNNKFYELIMVDPIFHPIGIVSLSLLMQSPRSKGLTDLMTTDFKVFKVTDSKDDVSYSFNQYHMVSAPVVDRDNRLVGVITIDDAMEALKDETDDDLKRLGGVGDEELSDSFLGITRARFPWLAVNLLTAILASTVIAQFAETIHSLVALAVLMPIVASMGGNAGTQTLTVAVRALATRDLTAENLKRVVFREVSVGLMNGLVFSIFVGMVAFLWYQSIELGLVLGAAMVCNMLVAGLAGILVPVGLSKLKVDPALSSAVCVTTVTDIVGLFGFLSLASFFLL